MAEPTVVTVNGRPTQYYPQPTPWPLGPGCESKTYRQSDEGTILAWDPYYGMSIDADAATCYQPEVTSWWFQTEGQPTSIALGPTFVCPEAYTAAQTLLEPGSTQHVYCCPTNYAFFVPQPNKPVFPSQCLSTATAGQTISYDQLTPKGDGMTYIPTTSVVKSEVVSIWAVPVNGYNFPSSSASANSESLTDSITSPTNSGPSTATEIPREADQRRNSSGPPLAMTVGISVGVVLVVLAICGGIFLCWRRRRTERRRSAVCEVEGQPVVKPPSLQGRQFELPAAEVLQTGAKHGSTYGAVQARSTIYELPENNREK